MSTVPSKAERLEMLIKGCGYHKIEITRKLKHKSTHRLRWIMKDPSKATIGELDQLAEILKVDKSVMYEIGGSSASA